MHICNQCNLGMEYTIIIDSDGTHHGKVCPKCGKTIKICKDENVFKDTV